MAAPSRPTGIATITSNDSIVIEWKENPEVDIQGYNVYNSTTSGGGISGYIKLNNELITVYSELRDVVSNTEETVTMVGGQRQTLIVEDIEQVKIFSYTHTNLLDGKRQYYVLTAVNNQNEESLYSIEVNSVPLNLTTDIVKFPVRSAFDVAKSMVDLVLERQPNIDVKPGTLTRDLHIDPHASEFGYLNIIIDFLSRTQSFITLIDFDDPSNIGESIPVAESTDKTLLKEAFQLTDDTDVQAVIDFAFDKLAGNYQIFREGATQSIGYAVFYTATVPEEDITIPVETVVSTNPTSAVPAINFETTTEAQMLVASIESYFNDATQRYEIQVPIRSIESGLNTVVSASTIVNSTFTQLSVTNDTPTENGRDIESNRSLANRGLLAFTSLDVGRLDGYQRTVIEVQGVEDVLIVDAGHPLMQRDYDEVRLKHVFGKVDIYFLGESFVTFTDNIGFLYKSVVLENLTILDATEMRVQVTNPSVIPSTPMYLVQQVVNANLAEAYDLTGNYTLFVNTIELAKDRYTVDLEEGDITFYDEGLTLGDQVTANYQYKSDITGEVLILAAIGGEIAFTLANLPVAIFSEVLTLTRAAVQTILVRDVDYTIDYTTGDITLSSGLIVGDSLTADYQQVIDVTGEVVVASATEGQTEATFANTQIVEAMVIEDDGVTINLNEDNVINSSIGMSPTDIIKASYKYRDTDPVILTNQPVDSIVSVTAGSDSLVEGTHYSFNKVDDILLEGNSVNATRSIQLHYDETTGLPAGTLSRQVDTLNLVGLEQKSLTKLGTDVITIVVTNTDRTVTYDNNVDYVLVPAETQLDYVTVGRISGSSITDGQDVLVTYEYGESIIVAYNVNNLIQTIQSEIDISRHITADVLVKQANQIDIDLEFTVKLKSSASQPVARSSLTTDLQTEVSSKKMGERINQSDVIRIIDNNLYVDYAILPLTKMAVSDGTHIANEELVNPLWSVFQTSTVTSYKTNAGQLRYSTAGSSSDDSKFWRVSQEDRELTLVANENLVADAAGQAYIAADGAIYVSTFDDDDPSDYQITVAYNVSGETGAKDIVTTDLDFLNLESLIIHIA